MVITDLDGTLFQSDHRISERNYKTLVELGERDVVRVIATGRHLFSAHKVLPLIFPIDYLVFSTGAGIMAWPDQKLLWSASMNAQEATLAFAVLSHRSLDFMIHKPIPENHRFVFFPSGEANPDFEARCNLYRDFAVRGSSGVLHFRKACQFVAIEPHFRSESSFSMIREELSNLKVIRTTSPLDGKSCWIEVFSNQVSKALASQRIARSLNIGEQKIMAVGNDYNDLDLLRWAATSYTVGGAPLDLRRKFYTVTSGDDSDFSEAVALWQGGKPPAAGAD